MEYLNQNAAAEAETKASVAAPVSPAVPPVKEHEVAEQPNTLVASQIEAKKLQKAADKERKKKNHKKRLASGHVSISEKMIFLDNMSTMMKAGLPLSATLATLQGEIKNKYFKTVIEHIRSLIENGEQFSSGLKAYPKVFPELLVATIEVGESSGLLSDVLAHLAGLLKAEKELKSKVMSALMYPMVVMLALIGVSLMLTLFVFPKLIEIFVEAKVKLPIILVGMQFLSTLLFSYGWYILGGVVVLIFGVRWLFRIAGPRAWLHQRMLELPLAGPLIREIALTRFAGNLKVLLSSGLPIIRSLETVSKTATNLQYQKAIVAMSVELGRGVALHEALASRPKLFPSLMVQLCKVGEETGELEHILEKVSEFYDTRVNNVLANLSVIIEPVLLIVVGVVVGFIAVSVIGPIYDLTNSFGDT
jgi:type IV pilus assembly protein PilC